MPKSNKVSKLFLLAKKNIRTIRLGATDSINKIENLIKKSGDKKLIRLGKEGKKELNAKFNDITLVINTLQKDLETEVRKVTMEFKSEIKNIKHLEDVTASDNLLLEYKKKELLLTADELESAYEEISVKNRELLAQRQQIDRQAEELRIANEELQLKTESLLDQSDYLHEANETIANMVNKLEQQNVEILRKNEELLNLNLEKNNLIGIVAHDLKSPLNQIKGLLSLVKIIGKVDDESAKYLDLMEQSAGRLNEMIAKILDVEAIESRQLNLKMESVNISEILNSLAVRYEADAVKKKIVMNHSIPCDLYVNADRNYVEQVLENLLSNAIKFSPFEKMVFINAWAQDGKIVCEIKDQGPGLSDDDKKKLFGKYQKLSARPTGNEISTGLGLSIVKKFVEAMNGEIWCESEWNKGASFFVKFKST